MTKMDVLRSVCFCDARLAAMGREELKWSGHHQAWYSADVPSRRTTWRSLQPTGGEPYLLHVCPFCGHDLPGVKHND